MSKASLCARDNHKNLQALVAFAIDEGWVVTRTRGGHVKFTKLGCPPIFTSSTPSDYRAGLNARALLRRAQPTNQLDQTL